ncbi:hypothetical protein [Estrella lausannensis]|uniref:Uncharacterized protein n=1 Tax=Estrella lausannensis TaxID=483423 RepID=A0A0H5DNN6_9BACT|nr:hypothetical protein [Estrella lausannensis]CRX37986.1 hypothetical protein ELAC_0632 [Estrella lausannensis]
MQSVALFFNTAIEGSNLIEEAGNALMAPVRVLFAGKTYSIEGATFKEVTAEETTILRIAKIAVSILLFIPLTIAGCLLKGVAQLKASVRERSDMLFRYLNTPTPPKQLHEEPFFKDGELYQRTIEALSCHSREVDSELTSKESAEIILGKLEVIVKHHVETAAPQFSKERSQEITAGFCKRQDSAPATAIFFPMTTIFLH